MIKATPLGDSRETDNFIMSDLLSSHEKIKCEKYTLRVSLHVAEITRDVCSCLLAEVS